jgi:hypothetical protein
MKVLSKILGAVLLLGCLAYISFVFGKYVLSSTLLKSIPHNERIISTSAPAPQIQNATQPPSGPQVEMRVMPSAPSRVRSSKPSYSADADDDDNSSDQSADQNAASADSDTPKKFDEGEVSPRRHRRSRRKKDADTRATPDKNPQADSGRIDSKSTKPKASTSSSAPIRRMNPVEKAPEKSPVPQPEKSTSTPSGSGDSASISPIPKPE